MENQTASVTVADLDALVRQIFDQKLLIEEAEAGVTVLNKELARLEEKAVVCLEELERDNYKTEFGTIYINEKWRVNMPQTDEDKQALFGFLREKGIFDKYATVNSNSLNSLYMAEWEAAIEDGKGMEFSMPGIGAPKLHKALGKRKK
jgi:hypothetical protein